MRTERRAVSGVFFVAGAVLASWVPYIPLVQRRLALGEGELGGALFAMTGGALCAVAAAGRLIERFGSRAVAGTCGLSFCLLLPAPIFAASFGSLAAALLFFGFAFGAMDVAMNAQAADVQRLAGKPLMSGFHALYSVGGLAGSAAAGLLLALGSPPLWNTLGAVAAMAALCAFSAAGMLRTPAGSAHRGPGLSLPLGPLALLSALAFVIFVGEGAVVDWATVYLANDVGIDPAAAVTGFAAFSLAMAAGRLTGDRLTARVGAPRFAVVSASLAAAGLGWALAAAGLAGAVTGFALAGLGFANLIPILFSRAAESTPEAPQRGIAGVAGIGYFGLVAGPPAIGFAAEAVSLRFALAAVAVAMAVAALLLPSAFRLASRPLNLR